MTKITIVGAGNVGSHAALYVAMKELGDIVLIDVVEGLPQGKALDLIQTMPLAGSDIKIKGTNNYADTKESDIVIITAGVSRKPGMSRDDLIYTNTQIVKEIVPKIVEQSPDCFLLIVTNPLDVMARLTHRLSGFPKQRVIGVAGLLDTVRMRALVAEAMNSPVSAVEALVIGSHDDFMVPLVSHCKVDGKPLKEICSDKEIKNLTEDVKKSGSQIIELLKSGSAFFAPGMSVTRIAEAILKDKKELVPCSVLLEGEYGFKGLFIGVPARIGKGGVEEIVEIDLNEQEKKAFEESVEHVKVLLGKLERFMD